MSQDFQPPLLFRNESDSVRVRPVYEVVVSDGTITELSPGVVSFGAVSGAGGGGITPPLIVGSGGTGQTSNTNRGVLIGSGGSPIEALAAMKRGQIVAGSDPVLAPIFIDTGAQGQMFITDPAGAASALNWADTAQNITTPVQVGSGGSGAVTFTTRGILIGSGTNAFEALSPLKYGQVLAGSSTVLGPITQSTGGAGTMFISSGGTETGFAFVATAGAGVSSVTPFKFFIQRRLIDSAGNNFIGTKVAGDFELAFAGTINSVVVYVDSTGTTGVETVDYNIGGASILSTKLTIDTAEKSSRTAAAPAVIGAGSDQLAIGDIWTVDIDGLHSASTGQGLTAVMEVTS